jgi:DNA (cytosine-5)-methyltransferase 1
MKTLTFLDLCSGIGGFRLGLESAGHKCIGYCEYDKFARASYEAMYDTEGEWKADDVTKLKSEDVPYADIWCFGFPCQDISVAGKQRGLVGKRSGIYYNIIDLLKGKEESDKPTYLLVENVKNLLSINAGFDFASVLSEMDEAGYDCRWQVLNSKDFGVPQNRERVFIIANLRSRGRREILPLCGENAATLNQLVGGMQGYRVYGTDGLSATLVGNAGGVGAKTGLYFIDQSNHAPKITDTARCLTARYTAGMVNHTAMNSAVMEVHPVLTPERMEKRQNGRRMKEDGEPMFTLTSQDRHGVFVCEKVQVDETLLRVRNGTKQGYDEAHVGDGICLAYPESPTRRGRVGKGCSQTLDCSGQMGTLMRCGRIRRLTPRECFRLQGFPDALFDRAASVNSDAQLYKQAGNAVTATVAFAVAMSLPESRENNEDNMNN